MALVYFLIGWLVLGGLYDFGRSEYVNAVILWALAAINYVFVKKN
jgi:hypothetical protein